MKKAQEYEMIAKAAKEQYSKMRSDTMMKNRESSKRFTFFTHLQYKRILRKMKKAASRGELFYCADIWTTISLVEKLQEDGFYVTSCDYNGEWKKDVKLQVVGIPQ